jgi:anti-sigma regulatory factor (Ser/Thr protein kinase)/serine/threonine protein phosphatase PrpC
LRPLAQKTIEVLQGGDVCAARQAAKAMVEALGFDAKVKEEVAIAVSELASNLVKHAGRGRLLLAPLREGQRAGIQIEAVDSGPGIADVERAMTDGFSTVGSLGCGLGAVNRLMDESEIKSQGRRGGGTRIVCRRWLVPEPTLIMSRPLDFGAATRPYPGKMVNGDAFVIEQWDGSALVAVIDGLGHGQFAHQAAQAARQYVETHPDQPLKTIFRGVGRTCRATQGVVMALARFDWNPGRLTFASVGNVEARIFGSPQRENFIVRRGVIGLNAPDPVVTEHRWELSHVMVLHSDGLQTHWRWEDFAPLWDAPASVVAQQLLQRLARDDDDVTVVVVRGMRGTPNKAG